jgi:hypothetical protein
MSGQEEPRVERSRHERPVTLKQNQICNQHSRKAALFTSRTIEIQNAAVRFSGISALRAESGVLIFDGRLSSTLPSSGDFRTTVAERIRNLESRGGCDPQGWLNVPRHKV